MRIGLITQPLVNNYGGILQNYALQETLRGLGHYAITIDQPMFPPRSLKWKLYSEMANIKRCIRMGNVRSISRRKWESLVSRETNTTKQFVDEYIERTPKVYGYLKTRELAESLNLDAYVVGSDQVWRPMFNSRIENNYLDFTQGWNVKRIAYAASFGVDDWEYTAQNTIKIRELANKFDAISVREYSGIRLCQDNLGMNAVHVLDPTMLLDASDYMRLVKNKVELSNSESLFCYILDPNNLKENIICECEKYFSVDRHFISSHSNSLTLSKQRVVSVPPISKWIQSFWNTKFVITDSFHGVVFSIIFNKQFLVIANKGRGWERFYSLLSLFNLENRLVNTEGKLDNVIENAIDWEYVNNSRHLMKNLSLDFLKQNL